MKKRLAAVCLLALGAFSLVGCGETGNSGTPSSATTGGSSAVAGDSSAAGGSSAAAGSYEIGIVTDVGSLMDGGFNQGTYEGAVNYANAHNKTYRYYQPANGGDASEADRITAMEAAIRGGAKIIVAPGFLQAGAMRKVAKENPTVDFVFVDGWTLTDSTNRDGNDNGTPLSNVTAITYKEQEAGYMAGYAAIYEGFTKLGGTFGGGGTNPACNRYAYGYVQGIKAAAKEANKTGIETTISFKYGSSFGASTELETQISGWYNSGIQVVFSCGGSMVNSVKSAAEKVAETDDGLSGRIIGVDVDQATVSSRVITSAEKHLSVSVEKILGQYYDGKWDAELGGKTQNLGAADDGTGLPTDDDSWRFKTFTKAQYDTLFNSIKNGTVTPKTDQPENCENSSFWTNLSGDGVTVKFEAQAN